MSEVVVRMDHVYKKFRKGEVFNSLRDFLPVFTGRMFEKRRSVNRTRGNSGRFKISLLR